MLHPCFRTITHYETSYLYPKFKNSINPYIYVKIKKYL